MPSRTFRLLSRPGQEDGVCSLTRARSLTFFCADDEGEYAAEITLPGGRVRLAPLTEEARELAARRFAPPLTPFCYLSQQDIPSFPCEGEDREALLQALSVWQS